MSFVDIFLNIDPIKTRPIIEWQVDPVLIE